MRTVRVAVPCREHQQCVVEITIESWRQWHWSQNPCRRNSSWLTLKSGCAKYLEKRPAELEAVVINEMVAKPETFKEVILEALEEAFEKGKDDNIKLILSKVDTFDPDLKKQVLEAVLNRLHHQTSGEILEMVVSKMSIGQLIERIPQSSHEKIREKMEQEKIREKTEQEKIREKMEQAAIKITLHSPQDVVSTLKERVESIDDDTKCFIISKIIDPLILKANEGENDLLRGANDLLRLLVRDIKPNIRLEAYKKVSELLCSHEQRSEDRQASSQQSISEYIKHCQEWRRLLWIGLGDKDEEVMRWVYKCLKDHKICVPDGEFAEDCTTDTHVALIANRIICCGGSEQMYLDLFKFVCENQTSEWIRNEAVAILAESRLVLDEISDRLKSGDVNAVSLCIQIVAKMCQNPSLRDYVVANEPLMETLKRIERKDTKIPIEIIKMINLIKQNNCK